MGAGIKWLLQLHTKKRFMLTLEVNHRVKGDIRSWWTYLLAHAHLINKYVHLLTRLLVANFKVSSTYTSTFSSKN